MLCGFVAIVYVICWSNNTNIMYASHDQRVDTEWERERADFLIVNKSSWVVLFE